jgi:hypothetical protein
MLMEEMAPVLESPELSLTDGGQIKVNGPPWRLVARRRWRNGWDFERRVRERESSDEAVCGGSGTVVFRGFQRYIEPLKTTRRERTEKDRASYLQRSKKKKIKMRK